MTDLVNLSLGAAGIYALLGYAVVFFGLILLMIVIMLMVKIMDRKKVAPAAAAPAAAPAAAAPAVPRAAAEKAPGSAGDFKLYNTDPRDAAMVMAIIAEATGKPLNELRFISIREVTDDEV